jgi:hypothetical protein
MNDILCPCINCVTFAICNSNNEYIRCVLLYKYFVEGGVNTKTEDNSNYYTHPQSDRLKEIEHTFDKRMKNWDYVADPLPNDTHKELQISWLGELEYA